MTDKQKMDKILRDLESDQHVQQMKNYTQHGKVSTYEHCERVARLSFELNRKLHLHAKVPTLIKGAMLHDFYLYDRPSDAPIAGRHSDIHPQIALANAEKYFAVNDVMRDVIENHMWPTGCERPKTEEGFIITLTDKYCAALEWSSHQIMVIPHLIASAMN